VFCNAKEPFGSPGRAILLIHRAGGSPTFGKSREQPSDFLTLFCHPLGGNPPHENRKLLILREFSTQVWVDGRNLDVGESYNHSFY
jgi:hypothetical protein